MTINVLAPSGCGEIFARVGQTNGGPWNSGASDYSYAGVGISGVAQGIAASVPGSYFLMSSAPNPGHCEYVLEATEFGTLLNTIFRSEGTYFNSSDVHTDVKYWGKTAAVLSNTTLLFGNSTGVAFTTGIAVLEGIRQ